MVATDALLAHVFLLRVLADELEDDRQQVIRLAASAGPLLAAELAVCEPALQEASMRARSLAERIDTAQQTYASGEQWARAMLEALAGQVAIGLGISARSNWLPIALHAAHAQRAAARLPGTPAERQAAVQRWILENPQVYTNPAFVDLVRLVVDGADEAALGAAGVPPSVIALLGPRGFGVLSTPTTARAVMGAAALGGGTTLKETPVRIEQVGSARSAPPAVTSAQRFDSIPLDEHVRIERHSAPGRDDTFVVYVAPTQTFSPEATGNPWDLTSNVAGVAGLSSGSMRATELAMQHAGVTPQSEVMFVGYSQGALVANQLATSGDWNAVALETFGAPGGVDVPEGIHGYTVRHTDDLVTATGGTPPPTGQLIVEKRAFAEGAAIPTADPMPSHQRRTYAETAAMIDAAASPQLRAQADALADFARGYEGVAGASITVTTYRGERVSPPQQAKPE